MSGIRIGTNLKSKVQNAHNILLKTKFDPWHPVKLSNFHPQPVISWHEAPDYRANHKQY